MNIQTLLKEMMRHIIDSEEHLTLHDIESFIDDLEIIAERKESELIDSVFPDES